MLAGSNSYSGPTTVNTGTLQIGNGGEGATLCGPGVTLLDNATLAFDHSDAMTYNGSISGSGSLSKLGSGTLTLNGANNYRGNTIIAAGTLVAGADDALSPMSNLLIDDGASVILDFGGDGDGGNFALGGVGEPVPALAARRSRRPMYRRRRNRSALALLGVAALAGLILWRGRRC